MITTLPSNKFARLALRLYYSALSKKYKIKTAIKKAFNDFIAVKINSNNPVRSILVTDYSFEPDPEIREFICSFELTDSKGRDFKGYMTVHPDWRNNKIEIESMECNSFGKQMRVSKDVYGVVEALLVLGTGLGFLTCSVCPL